MTQLTESQITLLYDIHSQLYFSTLGYVSVFKCQMNCDLPDKLILLEHKIPKYRTDLVDQLLEKSRYTHPNLLCPILCKIEDSNSIFQFLNESHTFIVYLNKPHSSLETCPINQSDIPKMMKQLVSACSYLESNGDYHGDIRQCHIYLNENGQYQLCVVDKAFGRQDNDKEEALTAPEILDQIRVLGEAKHNNKSDVFSLGMVLLESRLGMRTQDCYNYGKKRIHQDRVNNLIYQMKMKYTDKLSQIIECMLQFDPAERPTFNDLIE